MGSITTRSKRKASIKTEPSESQLEEVTIKCEVLNEYDADNQISCQAEVKNSFLEDFLEGESDPSIKQESDSDDLEFVEPKHKKKKKKKKITKTKSKDSQDSENDKEKLQKAEENEEHDKLILDNITMVCDLCGVNFVSYRDMKTHFRSEHGIEGYLTCCSKKFITRFYLVDHIKTHANPECFKCEVCFKIYPHRKALKIHSIMHGEVMGEFPLEILI